MPIVTCSGSTRQWAQLWQPTCEFHKRHVPAALPPSPLGDGARRDALSLLRRVLAAQDGVAVGEAPPLGHHLAVGLGVLDILLRSRGRRAVRMKTGAPLARG